MDRARWDLVQGLFDQVVELPAASRELYLRGACGDDPQLVADVLALVDAGDRDDLIIDRGIARVASGILEPHGSTGMPLDSFGPYAIGNVLGEGGMGVVYMAERVDVGLRVAIKVLRDAWLSPARRDRFAAEQRTLAQLSHPAIARLYDADTLPDGTPWFAMEYVEGLPLTEYCRLHDTTIEGRLELVRSVCEAVQHAHAHAVIHRDLKPSNILVKADGTVKLLDFGIAKHLESESAAIDQTRTGLRLMTPAYAAPEQIRGDRVGIRTDVYSLGVVMYELLAGRLPFDLSGCTPAEAASIIAGGEPERPSVAARLARTREAGGDRPRPRATGRVSWPDLDVLCLTAMHRDPERRYQTVEALTRDIDLYLKGQPLAARPDTLRYRAGKFVRRHRAAVSAAAMVIVLVVALVAFYTLSLARARNSALAEAARTDRIQRFMLSLFEGGDESAGPADDIRVVTLLDRGVQEARSLGADPAVQAELYATLGSIYQKLGRLDRADTLLRAALDERRALPGAHPTDVAGSLVALGLLRSDQAQYDEAERLIRDGLGAAARALPGRHPVIAEATAALGHVLVERGSYAEARRVLEQATALQSARGETTPELAATLHELADAHFYEGHWAEAESLTRRVLAMSRSLYGGNHPHVADDLIDLGAIQHEQGRYADAERYYRDALVITRSWYGDEHYKTASNLTMLARSLVLQKRFDEAERLLREALAIDERVFGPGHPRVASALNEMGAVALQRDRLDEAEAAFHRVAEIYRRTYPGGHYLIGTALSNIASVSMARARYVDAERTYRDAIAIYGKTLAPDHLNVGIARIKLGRSLLRQRKYAEAEQESRAGYDILAKQTDPSVSWLTSARGDLAAIYDALGQPERAAKYRAGIVPQPALAAAATRN